MTVQKDLRVGARHVRSRVHAGRVDLAGQRATHGPASHSQAAPTRPQAELRDLAAINAEQDLPYPSYQTRLLLGIDGQLSV
jgi:hypothetical protein